MDDRSKNIKKNPNIFIRHLIAHYAVPLLANFIAAMAGGFLGPLIAVPGMDANLEALRNRAGIVLPISFGLSIVIILIYNRHILYDVRRGRDFGPTARKKLLEGPLMYGLIGIFGWISALLANYVIIYYDTIDMGIWQLAAMSFSNITFSILCMAISYFATELLNRRWFIPVAFAGGKIGDAGKGMRISLRIRILIYFISAAIFQMLLFNLALITAHERAITAGIENLIHIPTLVVFDAALILTMTGITMMLIHHLETPMKALIEMAEKVKNSDFQARIPILSGDELGILGETMNEMAKDLGEKEMIKDAFGRMVDPSVRDFILSGKAELGGELRTATILFSDIRDFTSMSEREDPATIVTILNRYFERMARIIREEGGFVNKYIGDAVLALFNLPVDRPDHASCALRAARRMIQERQELNHELEREGLLSIRSGIGIHTGSVLAGNIGSSDRMEYTVIGDAVNLASRIEGITRKIDSEILVSRSTIDLIQDEDMSAFRRLGRFKVKGREVPVELFAADL